MQKQEREGDKNLSDKHKGEVESSSITINILKIGIYNEKGILQFHIQVIIELCIEDFFSISSKGTLSTDMPFLDHATSIFFTLRLRYINDS